MTVSPDINVEHLPRNGMFAARFDRALELGRIPGFGWSDRIAHWAMRIPLAGMLWYQGTEKLPEAFTDPGSFGVPAALLVLAALAELLGPFALAIGGIIETWNPKKGHWKLLGDAATRAGGFAGTAALLGVIYFFFDFDIPLTDPHAMLLGVAVFLLLRGNKYKN